MQDMMKKICGILVFSCCLTTPDYAMNQPKRRRLDNGGSVVVDKRLDSQVLQAVSSGACMGLWFLLDNHADPNACDSNGFTALMYAAINGRADLVRTLLVFGADVDAVNNNTGETALMLASINGHSAVVQQLLLHDEHANIHPNDDTKVLLLDPQRAILTRSANVNVSDKDGWTPLMVAAGKGYADIVRILLAAGADVNAHDKDDFTVLLAATAAGYAGIVEMLLDADADINIVEKKHGYTALALARAKGDHVIVQVFEEHRVNAELKAVAEAWPACPIEIIDAVIRPFLD
jgi:uncharacterized protein